jgi:hypothetical protein
MYGLGSAWLTKERDVMDKVGHPTQITSSEALKHFQVRAFLPGEREERARCGWCRRWGRGLRGTCDVRLTVGGESAWAAQVGPPHFMTARDWRLASPRWAEYAKAMWDKYKVRPLQRRMG